MLETDIVEKYDNLPRQRKDSHSMLHAEKKKNECTVETTLDNFTKNEINFNKLN